MDVLRETCATATRIRRFRWVGVRYADGEEVDDWIVVQEGCNEKGMGLVVRVEKR